VVAGHPSGTPLLKRRIHKVSVAYSFYIRLKSSQFLANTQKLRELLYIYIYIYLPGVLKKGSVNCVVKLFFVGKLFNQFDLINSVLDFLVFNCNLSLVFLGEGRGHRS